MPILNSLAGFQSAPAKLDTELDEMPQAVQRDRRRSAPRILVAY